MNNILIASKNVCSHVEKIFDGVFVVRPVEDWVSEMHGLLADDDGASESAGPLVDPSGLVLIGKANGSSDVFEQARTLATDCGIPVFEERELDALTITKWMLIQAIAQRASARQFSAQSRASAAMLRVENESLQRKFEALEGFLFNLGGPRHSKALELSPGNAEVTLVADETMVADPSATNACPAVEFVQRLPVSARGLIAIDIYCTHATDAGAGKLCLSFHDLADCTLGDAASLPLSEIGFGWNRLSLPFAIDSPDCEPQLKFKLECEDSEATLSLALASPVPIAHFRVRSPEGPAGDAPLALRAWRGLAGARLPSVQGVGEDGYVYLGADQVPRPRLLKADDPDMGFEPVEHWPKQNGILVHPPAQGLTVGIVENVPAGTVTGVSGVVNVEGAGSAPLDFAMVVVPAGFAARKQPLPPFKSWLTLAAKEWGEVHASMDHAMIGPVDLILATRVASGSGNSMAWALFRGFRLHTGAA